MGGMVHQGDGLLRPSRKFWHLMIEVSSEGRTVIYAKYLITEHKLQKK